MQSQRTKCKPVSLCPEMHIQSNYRRMQIEMRVTSPPHPPLINFTITRGRRNSDDKIYSSSKQNSNPTPLKKITHKHQLNRTLCKVCQNSGCIKNAFLHIVQIPHSMLLKCHFVLIYFQFYTTQIKDKLSNIFHSLVVTLLRITNHCSEVFFLCFPCQ